MQDKLDKKFKIVKNDSINDILKKKYKLFRSKPDKKNAKFNSLYVRNSSKEKIE